MGSRREARRAGSQAASVATTSDREGGGGERRQVAGADSVEQAANRARGGERGGDAQYETADNQRAQFSHQHAAT